MTYDPKAPANGARNKRIKTTVAKLIADYKRGRPARDCMDELVRVASDKPERKPS